MPKHTCVWVLADGSLCDKPTKYKIVKDDDENNVRKYDAFCPEHRARIDANPPSDEELEDDDF